MGVAPLNLPEPAQYIQDLEGEKNRQARQSFLLGTFDAALPRRRGQHAAMARQQRMAEERMARLRRGPLPEPWRPAHQHHRVDAQVLQEVDERKLIVQSNQLRMDRIQL